MTGGEGDHRESPAAWTRLRALLIAISGRQLTVGLGIGVARAAGFLTGAVVGRALGPDRFAAYSVAFTVFSSLIPLSSFADTWMVSRWEERSQPALGATTWWVKSGLSALLLVAALVTVVVVPKWPSHLGLDPALLLVAVLGAGAGALTTSVASWYQAKRDFRAYATLVAAPPCIALALAAALSALSASGPLAYIVALTAAYVPTAVFAYARLTGPPWTPTMGAIRIHAREALRFGGWVTIGSLAYVVFQRVDMVLLAAAAPSQAVGQYGAAVRLSMIGGLFGSTLTAVLMPVGSRRDTWMDRDARQGYVQESVLTCLIIVAVLSGAIGAAHPIMLATFGHAYDGAVALSQVLLFAQVLLIVQMPFYFAMYALDSGKWIAVLGLTQAVVAILSGYLLIQRYGAGGAAWSNVVTYALGVLGVGLFHTLRMKRLAR